MKIQVLSVEVNQATSKVGKAYEQMVVAYKNLDDGGKVASKQIMPFGFQKETFTTMKNSKPTEVYDVEVQKNEAGYNDWVKATKGTVQDTIQASKAPAQTVGATTATKGGWETPEERAKKQVYIIKQSSLSTATTILQHGRKTELKKEEVIELAQSLTDWVMGTDTSKVVSQDVGRIEDMESDIPF